MRYHFSNLNHEKGQDPNHEKSQDPIAIANLYPYSSLHFIYLFTLGRNKKICLGEATM